MAQKLLIATSYHDKPADTPELRVVDFAELVRWARQGEITSHLLRYQSVEFSTHHADVVGKPFLTAALLRLLSRGQAAITDAHGRKRSVTLGFVLRHLWGATRDYLGKGAFLARQARKVDQLAKAYAERGPVKLDLSVQPVYLRTDLSYGVKAGGSIGHIAGVLNNLDKFGGKPVFLTTDEIPTVRTDLETRLIPPPASYWNLSELPLLAANDDLERLGRQWLTDRDLSFIYQRYSTNNYNGLELAHHFGVPFVLEYNGSVIWMNRNWGKPLQYEALAEKIELLNFQAADLIVVVSQPMKDELIGRGVPADKILVNPNGVDPDRYTPTVDGTPRRQELGLEGKTVIGFIGTFGAWHGTDLLAEAYGRLLSAHPEYRERTRLLLIGDGVMMPKTKDILAHWQVGANAILTGATQQADGPGYLAACDILVSPTLPNPDGTPFFGSPTKLFEYMAMGKGIVASDLDQLGEVLDHDRTGWLTKPGDVDDLVAGLKRLIDDTALRERLGRAARAEACATYTWEAHTAKIISALKERCR